MLKRIAQNQFLRTTGFRIVPIIVTCIIVLGAVAILARTAAPAQSDPFAPFEPATFGIPDVVAGYRIVQVRTDENTACIQPGVMQLTIQPVNAMPGNPLASADGGDIVGALKALKPDAVIGLQYISIANPFTREQFLEQNQQWNLMMSGGCESLGGPIIIPTAESDSIPGA